MIKKSKVVRVHVDFEKMMNEVMRDRFMKKLASPKELNMVEATYLVTKAPSTPNLSWELRNLPRRRKK